MRKLRPDAIPMLHLYTVSSPASNEDSSALETFDEITAPPASNEKTTSSDKSCYVFKNASYKLYSIISIIHTAVTLQYYNLTVILLYR